MSLEDRSELVRQLNHIGQLSSGVGHHVINAFSAIVSNAELLRVMAESPGSVDPTTMADSIIRTAVEASGVARRLIDYSRTATATGDSVLRLDELVVRFVDQHRLLSPPGVEWVADCRQVPAIRGNEFQIENLLENLVQNSLESLPPAGGTISLRLARDDRGWILLDVHDTGQGIPPKAQERVLEPFFTTKNGHLGVGLSIAYGIWRRHRGTLAVQSRAGEGTRVRLGISPDRSGE